MEATKKRKQEERKRQVIDLTDDGDDTRPQTKVARKSPTISTASSFSVASYNVWFGPPHPFERMNAISSALVSQDLPPLFVGLQEVTPELSQMLFPLLESAGYKVVCQDLTDIGYGCAIAVQENACPVVSSGFVPYEQTIMGRGIVWVLARLEGLGREVLFTTTHLESFMRNYPSPGRTYDGVKERENQVKQLKAFCQDCMDKRSSVDMAIITGDLNWDDERKRSSGIDKPLLSALGSDWSDAWLDSWPGKEGYTYDSRENAMLKGNLRRRFDRCLLFRRKPTELVTEQVKMIGTDPIPGLEWRKAPHPMAKNRAMTVVPVLPSDHFGLFVKIQNRS